MSRPKSKSKPSCNSPLLSLPPVLTLRLPDALAKRVAITLVGCGGTGSHIASGLASLVMALGERGVSTDVLFIDPDVVEPKNIGRQLFSLADLGRPKAEVLASRLNAAFGSRVGCAVRPIDALDTFLVDDAFSLVIGAVDNAPARAMIAKQVEKARGKLWHLDCGNENHSGQIVLGNTALASDLKGAVALGMIDRLPAPHLVYPDLIKAPKQKGRGKAPSCAELTAAGEQGLMVNRMVASWACALLSDLLLARKLQYFGVAFDLAWGSTRAYTLDIPSLAQAVGMKETEICHKGG